MKHSSKAKKQKKNSEKQLKKVKKAPESKPAIKKGEVLKAKFIPKSELTKEVAKEVMPEMIKPKKKELPGFSPVTDTPVIKEPKKKVFIPVEDKKPEGVNIPDTIPPTIPPVKKKVFSPEEVNNGKEVKSKSPGVSTNLPKAGTQFNSYKVSKIKEVVEFLNTLPADRKQDMLGYINAHQHLSFTSHAGMSQSVRMTCDLSNHLIYLVAANCNGGDAKDIAINHLENNL